MLGDRNESYRVTNLDMAVLRGPPPSALRARGQDNTGANRMQTHNYGAISITGMLTLDVDKKGDSPLLRRL